MRIDDEEIWGSLAAYMVQKCEYFTARDLSNQVYALTKVSKMKTIILNFDDLFRRYELHLVKKMDLE